MHGEWWIGQDIPCLSTKLDVSKFRPIDIFRWQQRKHIHKTFRTWTNDRIESEEKWDLHIWSSLYRACIRLFRVASPDKCSHLEAKCLNGNFNLIVCHCWSSVFTLSHFRLRFISNLHLLRGMENTRIYLDFDSFE